MSDSKLLVISRQKHSPSPEILQYGQLEGVSCIAPSPFIQMNVASDDKKEPLILFSINFERFAMKQAFLMLIPIQHELEQKVGWVEFTKPNRGD